MQHPGQDDLVDRCTFLLGDGLQSQQACLCILAQELNGDLTVGVACYKGLTAQYKPVMLSSG